MQQTVFSPAQMKILHLMSYIKTSRELDELQNVISDYFAQKADKELDELWQQGVINESTIEQWGKEHLRASKK